VGEAYTLIRQSTAAHGAFTAHEVVNAVGGSPRDGTLKSSAELENICRQIGITVDELAMGKKKLAQRQRQEAGRLKAVGQEEVIAKAASKPPTEECAFEGLNSRQALIVVSHVREEIPGMVNEYVRLPGEEEASEQGRGVEIGMCDDGSIRTAEVWNKIWGLRA
jgi:hypothetical protein